MSGPLDIAVMFDSPDENWPSMDLAGEMLFAEWQSNRSLGVDPTRLSIRIPSMARRLPGSGALGFNADRALARYLAYPLRAFAARRRASKTSASSAERATATRFGPTISPEIVAL